MEQERQTAATTAQQHSTKIVHIESTAHQMQADAEARLSAAHAAEQHARDQLRAARQQRTRERATALQEITACENTLVQQKENLAFYENRQDEILVDRDAHIQERHTAQVHFDRQLAQARLAEQRAHQAELAEMAALRQHLTEEPAITAHILQDARHQLNQASLQ